MSERKSKPVKKQRGTFGAKSVSELIGGVLEPVLARRTGMTLDLLQAWPELAGEEFRNTTRPEKIDWPRRIQEEDPFEPATLVVACDGSVALFFQHEQAVILERVNVFFGFQAVRRIKIVQKSVTSTAKPPVHPEPALSQEEEVRLASMLDEIDDPELKKTLERLGRGVLQKK